MEKLLLLAVAFLLISGCCACPIQSYRCPDGSYAPDPELCGTPSQTATPAATATPVTTARTPTPSQTASPAATEEPEVTPPPPDYAGIAGLIFNKTNEERVGTGLQPLAHLEALGNAARWQSCCCARSGILEHESAECGNVNLRLLMFGLPMQEGAENIGKVPDAPSYYAHTMEPTRLYSDEEVAQRFVTGWMNSPPHRANIMDPRYTHLGVGVCKEGHYFYATQNFIISGET